MADCAITDDAIGAFRFHLPSYYPCDPEVKALQLPTSISGIAADVAFGGSGLRNVRGADSDGKGDIPDWIITWYVDVKLGGQTLDDGPFRLSDALLEWWVSVTAWLTVWTGVAPGIDRMLLNSLSPIGGPRPPDADKMHFYGHDNGFRISVDQLRRALDTVGRGVTIPLEYELLVEATATKPTYDHRMQVMNACGAVELAAERAIYRKLVAATLTEGFAERIRKGTRGLVPLAETSRDLQLLPDAAIPAIRQLAAFRNGVVHRGEPVETDKAWWAVNTAWRTVQLLSAEPGGPADTPLSGGKALYSKTSAPEEA